MKNNGREEGRKDFSHKKPNRKKTPHGYQAEEIAVLAAKELIARGKLSAYVHAKHNDSLDASHIDLAVINLHEKKLLVLQIKTKVKRKIRFGYETPAEKHRRKYPHIPVIEIKIGGSRRRVIQKTKKEILRLYRQTPSAEKVLDRKVLEIIYEKFRFLGYNDLFFYTS